MNRRRLIVAMSALVACLGLPARARLTVTILNYPRVEFTRKAGWAYLQAESATISLTPTPTLRLILVNNATPALGRMFDGVQRADRLHIDFRRNDMAFDAIAVRPVLSQDGQVREFAFDLDEVA